MEQQTMRSCGGSMLKAALVGQGPWGRALVESVQSDGQPKGSKIRFRWVVARDERRESDFIRRHGLAFHANLRHLLATERVDCVVIATPVNTHPALVSICSQFMRPVLVEKPLAACAAEATQIFLRKPPAAKVFFAYVRRFSPPLLEMVDLVRRGVLGRIVHVDCRFGGDLGYSSTYRRWAMAGATAPITPIESYGIHCIDSAIRIGGSVVDVAARFGASDVSDTATQSGISLLRFASKATGSIQWSMCTAPYWQVTVYGDEGWAQTASHTELLVRLRGRPPRTTNYEALDLRRAMVEAFADSCAGAPWAVSTEEGLHGLKVMDAIYRSARNETREQIGETSL